MSRVVELDIDGKKQKVIPREVAYNVISDEPIHIDFMRIVSGKREGGMSFHGALFGVVVTSFISSKNSLEYINNISSLLIDKLVI